MEPEKMSHPMIKVEHLSKKYQIGVDRTYKTLQDSITTAVKSPLSIFKKNNEDNTFWALKDVSFEVEEGEVVGIIGRNGAGKSTLLKILSRITEPTEGKITMRGRVASLLEVGTGFHPELSGRENVYLNGSILGMKKREIDTKFDEIVKFAEIEKFLDTPVKRYSSGMYVRLAFAVAAHLEPEILMIDEVLAVGDVAFQKKCLGKMSEVSKEGRTVLFVSHNMNAIEQLCNSGILLDEGRMKFFSEDIRSLIKNYLFGHENENNLSEWINNKKQFQNSWFKPLKFFVTDEKSNKLSGSVANNSEIWVQIEGIIEELDPALTIGYAIFTEEGILLYWSYQTDESEDKWPKLKRGHCVLRSNIPKRFLNQGIYRIELIGSLHFRKWLFEPGVSSPAIFLNIQGGLSDSPHWMIKRPGILAPVMEWSIAKRSSLENL